jgi:hypothetical protein
MAMLSSNLQTQNYRLETPRKTKDIQGTVNHRKAQLGDANGLYRLNTARRASRVSECGTRDLTGL